MDNIHTSIWLEHVPMHKLLLLLLPLLLQAAAYISWAHDTCFELLQTLESTHEPQLLLRC